MESCMASAGAAAELAAGGGSTLPLKAQGQMLLQQRMKLQATAISAKEAATALTQAQHLRKTSARWGGHASRALLRKRGAARMRGRSAALPSPHFLHAPLS